MIKDFRKTKFINKIYNWSVQFFYILQLPHTVISNSEKLTHLNVQLEFLSYYFHHIFLYRTLGIRYTKTMFFCKTKKCPYLLII